MSRLYTIPRAAGNRIKTTSSVNITPTGLAYVL
jgi:hypothetical protein